MSEDQVLQREQCKYCQRSINTSHCVEHSAHIEQDRSFWCHSIILTTIYLVENLKNNHSMENRVTYSLYEFRCGNLREFGGHSRRAKYKTVDEALAYVKSYIERMSKIHKISVDSFFDLQILIVEYTGAYQSRIVGMITKDVISVAPWIS